MLMSTLNTFIPEVANIPELLHGVREDFIRFLHQDVPKILLVAALAFVFIRVFRALVSKMTSLQERRLPGGIRAQQVRTLSGVINSVGVFVIIFVATLMILGTMGLN